MPMGIGPGLSVTRFESGIPGWMTGMDLGWDFTQNVQYSGATNPTDTHSATVYAQSAAGVWSPFAANTLVRTDLGLQTVPTRVQLTVAPIVYTGSGWTRSSIAITTGQPDPAGGNAGSLATESANNALMYDAAAITVGSGTRYAVSKIVVRGNSDWIRFGVCDTTLANISQAWFNLATGAVGTQASAGTGYGYVSHNIQALSRGYYVVTQIVDAPTTTMRTFVNTAPSDGSSARNNTGGGAGIGTTYGIWSSNVTAGAFAVPPILTGAATVDGNRQVVDLTGRLGSGVGLIMQFNAYDVTAAFKVPFMFNDGTGPNTFIAYMNNGGGQSITQVYNSSINQGTVNLPGTPAVGVQTWVAVAGPNYHRSQRIGQSAGTADTTVTWPALTRLAIGGTGYNATDNMYMQTRRLALRFGAANDAMFNDLVAKATLLAAVS